MAMTCSNSCSSYPWLSYQPIRLAYTLYRTTTIAAQLPLWLFLSLVPGLRPRRSWSIRQALSIRLLRAVVQVQARIGISAKLSLEPGREGRRFQVIKPFPAGLYKGRLQSDTVLPADTAATWFPARPGPELVDKTVALYVHGGAFVFGDGRTFTSAFQADTLRAEAGVDVVFSLQYRLSAHEGENPFPAALQDVLTAYLFLVRTLHVSPRQLVLVGDSAGGNLIIGLLRYLAEFGHELGLLDPKAAMLVSPWVAPLNALEPGAITGSPNYDSDFLTLNLLQWGARAYSGGAAGAPSDPYITPLAHPFRTQVPIFLNLATAEILEAEGTQWAQEMRAEGNELEVNYEQEAPHDSLVLGPLMGWESSARGVAMKMGSFLANA